MNTTPDLKPKHDPLMGIHAVMAVSSLSKASIYRLMRAGNFPHATQLSPGRVAWRESEVLRWAAAPMEWGMEREF